jgi:hypothetical protein
VELDPGSGTWRLSKAAQGPKDSPAQRMAKTYDRRVDDILSKPNSSAQKPSKENKTTQVQVNKPSKKIQDTTPGTLNEDIQSESVITQAKELEKRKQPKLTEEQNQRELNKNEYLKSMVDLILKSSSAEKGAGKNTLSREDLQEYMSYLDGNKPTIPDFDISDEDVDGTINMLKEVVGKGAPWSRFISRIEKKGDPPKGMSNRARARAVIKFYLQTGGVSSITGRRIPFSDTQLDHRVSLNNGGIDGPDNWEFVEARFNQFKGALTDEELRNKLKQKLSVTPEEERRTILQQELQNVARKNYVEFFTHNGFSNISVEDIQNASGPGGEQFLKAIAQVAKIPTYPEGKERSTGRGGGGRFIGYPALKEKLIASLSPQSRNQINQINQGLIKIAEDISSRQEEIKGLSKTINQQRAEARKKAKANLSEADYLEILKAKRASNAEGGGANYSDSMVFYRGKALGRCPAGTTRSGRTCVPSTSTP